MNITTPETITALEFAPTIPCGGTTHQTGTNWHVVGQVASRAVISQCCGFRLVLCKGRADYLQQMACTINCSQCHRDSSASDWRFETF